MEHDGHDHGDHQATPVLALVRVELGHVAEVHLQAAHWLLAALGFYRAVGPVRIWERVQGLQRHLREGLGGIPGIRLRSAVESRTAGMVSFTVDGVAAPALQRWLAREARVRTRVIGEFGLNWMRVSTHYYNSTGELDRVLELLDRAAREGIPTGPER